ncbi:DUF5809 family protein [Halobacteriales archaeon Cl-PHB]
MDTEGAVAPETTADARQRFEEFAPAAAAATSEVARAVLDPDEFDDRVTDDVVARAHEAIFASRLQVHVGSREEFDDWLADRDVETVELGSDNVDNVAWHHAPFADTVVAATFSAQREAAVETLRRQAMGRFYAEVV